MNPDVSVAIHSRQQEWLPILEIAVQEVFDVMLGYHLEPSATAALPQEGEFTAMVGLAGALCGVLTFRCRAQSATQIATCMLGPEIASSERQSWDALGEICNMIAGNFKNKLTGLDGRCLLSVPTIVTGGSHRLHSMAHGDSLETVMNFEGAPIVVRLELQR